MDLFQYLKMPEIQLLLIALPMIFVLDSPTMHKIMSERFTKFALRTFPLTLGLAVVMSFVHPLGIGFAAVVLTPHIQWSALRWLYLRYLKKHGHPPRTSSERLHSNESSVSDYGFRVSTDIALILLPLIVGGITFWLATEGRAMLY